MASEVQAGFEASVAWIVEPEVRRSILGKRKIRVPQAGGVSGVFCLERFVDGACRLDPVTTDVVEYEPTTGGQFLFVIVSSAPHDIKLEFSSVAKDSAGYPFDLIFQCSVSVLKIEQFINEVVVTQASPERPMSVHRTEAWMENAIRTRLREQVAEQLERYSFEELRDQEVLQSSWWERKVENWLAGTGVGIKIASARWESPDADRAEKERLSRIEMKRQLDASEKAHELELEIAEKDAAHRARIDEIRKNEKLAEEERKHEEKLASVRREIELQKEYDKLRELKASKEADSLAAEATIARRNRQEAQARELEQKRLDSIERRRRESAQDKLQHADQITALLKANPEILERLTQEVRGGGLKTESSPAAQKRPPEAPPAGGKTPPPVPGRLSRREKIRAAEEARAQARTTDAQSLMKDLSDVYDDAATAQLSETAAGEPAPPSFDYKHISKLFGDAATGEKPPKKTPELPKIKKAHDVRPKKPRANAAEGLAGRLQGLFEPPPLPKRKAGTKPPPAKRKPPPLPGKPSSAPGKPSPTKRSAPPPVPAEEDKDRPGLHQRFSDLYGSGEASTPKDRSPQRAVGDAEENAAEADEPALDKEAPVARDGDKPRGQYDADHFSSMFNSAESKDKADRRPLDKSKAVFDPSCFLKKAPESSDESQGEDKPDQREDREQEDI